MMPDIGDGGAGIIGGTKLALPTNTYRWEAGQGA